MERNIYILVIDLNNIAKRLRCQVIKYLKNYCAGKFKNNRFSAQWMCIWFWFFSKCVLCFGILFKNAISGKMLKLDCFFKYN